MGLRNVFVFTVILHLLLLLSCFSFNPIEDSDHHIGPVLQVAATRGDAGVLARVRGGTVGDLKKLRNYD